MNKYKKIAAAVVSTVMAGTMVASLAACDNNKPNNGNNGGNNNSSTNVNLTELPDLYDVVNDETGDINYDSYNRSNVSLNIAIGHNSNFTSTSFGGLGGQITLPDGKTYEDNEMKPAWVAMGKDLNIKWNDVWGKSKEYEASQNLNKILSDGTYANTDLFTTNLSVAVEQAAAETKILNLGNYLNYMPHFAAFLNNNPIVYLSLLQYGMVTSGDNAGANKILYIAPYFDGNDDIERYCLIRQDWAAKLLNGNGDIANTAQYATACAATTSVTSYMGTSGKLEIDSTSEDGKSVIKINKNYDAVLAAVKGTGALADAYKAITNNTAYTGDSGNIVDIMNAALAVNANATGEQLTKLFRAYIDVCYEGHYTAEKRANLFNGYDACWDVDDLVAMLRCIKASGTALTTNNIRAIGPRDGSNDRTPDMVRLAAQLYGVRGADSRYENTYIDGNGDLQDARNDKEFYVALENFHKLREENLVADYSASGNYKGAGGIATDSGSKTVNETFMMYDYCQTQTINGFYAEDDSLTGQDVPDDYYLAPIITPISKWDTDGKTDNGHETVMRFTESWRSTKTGGLALNGALAEAGNEEKLKAALQFVDYLYSQDGQIVSTFGPKATSADSTDGFWYNTEATEAEVTAENYFTFKGVKYSGTDYKGKTTPTITEKTYASFKGKTVNGYALNGVKDTVGVARLNFTNYARYLIGSTLPVGVKDQSFENQLTSLMGQAGAGKVGTALANGTIKGLTLKVDSNNWWYTCVPTGLPIESSIVKVLSSADMDKIQYITGKNVNSGNKAWYSIFNYVILNGATGIYNQQQQTVTMTSVDNLLEQISETMRGQIRENGLASGWNNAKNYWTYLSSAFDVED